MQLCVYWKCMRPDISFTCKKYPCFPQQNKTEDSKFDNIKTNLFEKLELSKIQAEIKVMKTKIDDDQNSYRWLKSNIDPFLISTVETHSLVLRFKT